MRLFTTILLLSLFYITNGIRIRRRRCRARSFPSFPSSDEMVRSDVDISTSQDSDTICNKPHPSLSCLLFDDDGCETSCNLFCDLYQCQSKGFCNKKLYCGCNEVYQYRNKLLTPDEFRDLTFEELWDYKFVSSGSSKRIRNKILQDSDAIMYILTLLRNPHKTGDDIKAAIVQNYPQFKDIQNVKARDLGVKSKLKDSSNLEQYIQNMIGHMKKSVYNRISHARYMRRLINLINDIGDKNEIKYILRQIRLTGNDHLYNRLRKFLIKKKIYFDSDEEFGLRGRRIKRQRCNRCRPQRKMFYLESDLPYDDEDEAIELILMNKLMNTSTNSGAHFIQTDDAPKNTPTEIAEDIAMANVLTPSVSKPSFNFKEDSLENYNAIPYKTSSQNSITDNTLQGINQNNSASQRIKNEILEDLNTANLAPQNLLISKPIATLPTTEIAGHAPSIPISPTTNDFQNHLEVPIANAAPSSVLSPASIPEITEYAQSIPISSALSKIEDNLEVPITKAVPSSSTSSTTPLHQISSITNTAPSNLFSESPLTETTIHRQSISGLPLMNSAEDYFKIPITNTAASNIITTNTSPVTQLTEHTQSIPIADDYLEVPASKLTSSNIITTSTSPLTQITEHTQSHPIINQYSDTISNINDYLKIIPSPTTDIPTNMNEYSVPSAFDTVNQSPNLLTSNTASTLTESSPLNSPITYSFIVDDSASPSSLPVDSIPSLPDQTNTSDYEYDIPIEYVTTTTNIPSPPSSLSDSDYSVEIHPQMSNIPNTISPEVVPSQSIQIPIETMDEKQQIKINNLQDEYLTSYDLSNENNVPSITSSNPKRNPESYGYYLFSEDGNLDSAPQSNLNNIATTTLAKNRLTSPIQSSVTQTITPMQNQITTTTQKDEDNTLYYVVFDENGNILKSNNYKVPGQTTITQTIASIPGQSSQVSTSAANSILNKSTQKSLQSMKSRYDTGDFLSQNDYDEETIINLLKNSNKSSSKTKIDTSFLNNGEFDKQALLNTLKTASLKAEDDTVSNQSNINSFATNANKIANLRSSKMTTSSNRNQKILNQKTEEDCHDVSTDADYIVVYDEAVNDEAVNDEDDLINF